MAIWNRARAVAAAPSKSRTSCGRSMSPRPPRRPGARSRHSTKTGAGHYPSIAQGLWRRARQEAIPFFAFSPEIRCVIYTTNAIESLNRIIRKAIKAWGSFPSEDAAEKLIPLAIRGHEKTARTVRGRLTAVNQFALMFEDRFKPVQGRERSDGDRAGRPYTDVMTRPGAGDGSRRSSEPGYGCSSSRAIHQGRRRAWPWGVSLANLRRGGSRQRKESPSPAPLSTSLFSRWAMFAPVSPAGSPQPAQTAFGDRIKDAPRLYRPTRHKGRSASRDRSAPPIALCFVGASAPV